MAYRRLMGRGMDADLAGAYHDFQAAAEQGDMFAIFNLGYMWMRVRWRASVACVDGGR